MSWKIENKVKQNTFYLKTKKTLIHFPRILRKAKGGGHITGND